jgi:hypothetical protein
MPVRQTLAQKTFRTLARLRGDDAVEQLLHCGAPVGVWWRLIGTERHVTQISYELLSPVTKRR